MPFLQFLTKREAQVSGLSSTFERTHFYVLTFQVRKLKDTRVAGSCPRSWSQQPPWWDWNPGRLAELCWGDTLRVWGQVWPCAVVVIVFICRFAGNKNGHTTCGLDTWETPNWVLMWARGFKPKALNYVAPTTSVFALRLLERQAVWAGQDRGPPQPQQPDSASSSVSSAPYWGAELPFSGHHSFLCKPGRGLFEAFLGLLPSAKIRCGSH